MEHSVRANLININRDSSCKTCAYSGTGGIPDEVKDLVKVICYEGKGKPKALPKIENNCVKYFPEV